MSAPRHRLAANWVPPSGVPILGRTSYL